MVRLKKRGKRVLYPPCWLGCCRCSQHAIFSSHPEVLGHSDAEHSEHHNLYHDDEHIYEEIGPPAPGNACLGFMNPTIMRCGIEMFRLLTDSKVYCIKTDEVGLLLF